MTSAEKVKAIKVINTRYKDLVKAADAGAIPQYEVDNFKSAMELAAGDSILKSGNISHGKKAVDTISDDALQALLSKPTAGKAKAKIRQAAKEEGVSEKQYVDMVQTVKEAATIPGLLSDAIKAYGSEARQGRNTSYKTLANALDSYKNAEKTHDNSIKDKIADRFNSAVRRFFE